MKQKSQEFRRGLWGVFSSAAFCTYSWSIVIFFWDIPSFLLRYSTTDILGYAAYQFMFALFESILVTIFVIFFSFILPAKFIRNTFQNSGTALVFAFALNAIFFKELFNIINWATVSLPLNALIATQLVIGLWICSLITLPIGFVIASKKVKVERGINKFVENLSILVSLYVFWSIIGTLIVIIRNVF